MTPTLYAVEGMTCDHCRSAVDAEVTKVAGVASVDVDIDRGLVRVHGAAVDPAAVVASSPPRGGGDGGGRRGGGGGMTPSRNRFVRHYVEMVVAMFLGMAILA